MDTEYPFQLSEHGRLFEARTGGVPRHPFFFFFYVPNLWHMEAPRLGVEGELQPQLIDTMLGS